MDWSFLTAHYTERCVTLRLCHRFSSVSHIINNKQISEETFHFFALKEEVGSGSFHRVTSCPDSEILTDQADVCTS